jgi:hypothetical protein
MMSANSVAWFTVTAVVVIGIVAGRSIVAAAADAPPAPTTAPAPSRRVFELRKYYAAAGKLDALNARFRDHTCALFQKHGMELIGFWMPSEGPDAGKVLIYMLAFPSKEAKEASWKAFQQDPEWIKVKSESEKDGKLTDKIESTLMTATDYSAIK